jgi:hypothetical protein
LIVHRAYYVRKIENMIRKPSHFMSLLPFRKSLR